MSVDENTAMSLRMWDRDGDGASIIVGPGDVYGLVSISASDVARAGYWGTADLTLDLEDAERLARNILGVVKFYRENPSD